jgi:adenylate cyclase
VRQWLDRAISIAAVPADDDDLRLRKRVAVIAGFVTIAAALVLPFLGDWTILSVAGALLIAVFMTANLAFLARTRQFRRYAILSFVSAAAYTLFADVAEGGLAASGGCVVWALLIPVFAILFLGPRDAMPWFVVFLAVLVTIVVIDPVVSARRVPAPYWVQLVYWVENIAVPGAIIFVLLRYTDVRRLTAQVRSDELLTNAIPGSIAARLKHGEVRIAERYPDTTILFSDIVGFTAWARRTDARRVVDLLDRLFTRFDELAAEHGVEKIKTIGDSYMVASGAPDPRLDHAEAALAMASSMLVAFDGWRSADAPDLAVRIGLASGEVVAGVIGRQRALFDLWGDTVNLASRMESSGVPGRVQVAQSTWALLRDRHAFEERGPMDVKGLGMTQAYLLVR